MDGLDAALLRGLLRNHTFDFPGIDPRRTVTEISSEVGISRNAARERLNAWRTSGFLAGMSAYVNPEFYGLHFVGQYFRIKDTGSIGGIREALGSSKGLFLTYEYGNLVGNDQMLSTLHAFRNAEEEQAQHQAFQSLSALERVSPPFPVRFPSPKVGLDAFDRRLVVALREKPDSGARQLAKRLGISVKRARRHLDALLDGDALFLLPHFDFTRGRGSVLLVSVFFPADADYQVMLQRIRQMHSDLVQVFPSTSSELILPRGPGEGRLTFIAFLLPVRTGQLAGAVEIGLRKLTHVLSVAVSYPIRSYENKRCFDKLLEGDALSKQS